MKALQSYGIPFNSKYLVYGDFMFDSGQRAANLLLDQAPEITAIFSASDEMAVAAISVASSRGIKVPEDLSVIGYDNIKLAEMIIPPLTTVHQPLNKMGKMACEKLIYMIRTGEVAKSTIAAHSIVERQSVAQLK
ncbi:HTH-type transcriptional repressor CytR [compost metagenome]